MTPAYIEEYTPAMLYLLALAGARVAEVLNLFTSKHSDKRQWSTTDPKRV